MDKIAFEKHIIELLKHNDCVVLPGFGGFISKSKPSSIHQNIIYPPSRQIAFNAAIQQDDELLTGALMHAYKLAYTPAKNKVITYANHIAYTLKKEQHVSLKQIGAFSVGENNQIIFKPFLNNIIDKEAFGFNKLHIKPVSKPVLNQKLKTKVKAKPVKIQEERKQKVRKRSKLPVLGLIGSIALMTGIIGLVATNTVIEHPSVQHAGFVDMLFPNDTFLESEGIATEIYREHQLYPSKQKEGYTTGEILSFQNQEMAEGYYLVIGSYSSRKNAERMEANLFNNGKDSYILPTDNGFYRVCEFAGNNYLNAKEKMFASNSEGAWLLKNKLSY